MILDANLNRNPYRQVIRVVSGKRLQRQRTARWIDSSSSIARRTSSRMFSFSFIRTLGQSTSPRKLSKVFSSWESQINNNQIDDGQNVDRLHFVSWFLSVTVYSSSWSSLCFSLTTFTTIAQALALTCCSCCWKYTASIQQCVWLRENWHAYKDPMTSKTTDDIELKTWLIVVSLSFMM